MKKYLVSLFGAMLWLVGGLIVWLWIAKLPIADHVQQILGWAAFVFLFTSAVHALNWFLGSRGKPGASQSGDHPAQISEAPVARWVKIVSVALAVIGAASFYSSIALNIWFYRIGSRMPDQSTARTYPVQEHGTLYVSPLLGMTAQALFFFFLGCLALLIFVNYVFNRANIRTPWDDR